MKAEGIRAIADLGRELGGKDELILQKDSELEEQKQELISLRYEKQLFHSELETVRKDAHYWRNHVEEMEKRLNEKVNETLDLQQRLADRIIHPVKPGRKKNDSKRQRVGRSTGTCRGARLTESEASDK